MARDFKDAVFDKTQEVGSSTVKHLETAGRFCYRPSLTCLAFISVIGI